MRLPRPHIPMAVKVQVAHRQLREAGGKKTYLVGYLIGTLEEMLEDLFGKQKVHLDHDPPLATRVKIENSAGEIIDYHPSANDPRYLIYRTVDGHKLKTNVRGDGAQHPDRVLIKKIRRIEGKGKKKKKYKWPKRKMRGGHLRPPQR